VIDVCMCSFTCVSYVADDLTRVIEFNAKTFSDVVIAGATTPLAATVAALSLTSAATTRVAESASSLSLSSVFGG
jgi:hypothetical protein